MNNALLSVISWCRHKGLKTLLVLVDLFLTGRSVAKPQTKAFFQGGGPVYLDYETPCKHSIYRRFGRACFYIQAFQNLPNIQDLMLNWSKFTFKFHRVMGGFCKNSERSEPPHTNKQNDTSWGRSSDQKGNL